MSPPARSSVRAVEGRQRTRNDRFETEAFIKLRRTCTYIYMNINKGYHPMKFEGSGSKGTCVIERKRSVTDGQTDKAKIICVPQRGGDINREHRTKFYLKVFHFLVKVIDQLNTLLQCRPITEHGSMLLHSFL